MQLRIVESFHRMLWPGLAWPFLLLANKRINVRNDLKAINVYIHFFFVARSLFLVHWICVCGRALLFSPCKARRAQILWTFLRVYDAEKK